MSEYARCLSCGSDIPDDVEDCPYCPPLEPAAIVCPAGCGVPVKGWTDGDDFIVSLDFAAEEHPACSLSEVYVAAEGFQLIDVGWMPQATVAFENMGERMAASCRSVDPDEID